MKPAKLIEILKAFPNPFDINEIIGNQSAVYFIKDDNTNAHHLVMGPYFLSDAWTCDSRAYLDENGKNEYGCVPSNAPLLLNTVSWDGKGFGLWALWEERKRFHWINLNLLASGVLPMGSSTNLKAFGLNFNDYREDLKTLKTLLILMGFDITPNAERMEVS